MMSYGYKPELSEGPSRARSSRPPPLSLKALKKAKPSLKWAYGLREKNEGEEMGLIYSRITIRTWKSLKTGYACG